MQTCVAAYLRGPRGGNRRGHAAWTPIEHIIRRMVHPVHREPEFQAGPAAVAGVAEPPSAPRRDSTPTEGLSPSPEGLSPYGLFRYLDAFPHQALEITARGWMVRDFSTLSGLKSDRNRSHSAPQETRPSNAVRSPSAPPFKQKIR